MNKLEKKLLVIIMLVFFGTMLISCVSNNGKNPDIIGEIKSLNNTDNGVSILVEGNITEHTTYDKASISVNKKTKVYMGSKKSNIEELKEGQEVAVIFTGPVSEIYPVRTDAKEVRIIIK